MGLEFSIHDRVWFTADSHFGHENIIKYCNRPFSNSQHMDEVLIERWNSVVKPNDVVFHLGDFTLQGNAIKYFGRLKGKIYVLRLEWHHDKRWLKSNPYISNQKYEKTNHIFVRYLSPISVIHITDIRPNRKFPITLSHYPMAQWEASHYNAWHLYGHSHGNHESDPTRPFALDVGVDCWNYYPVSLEKIHETMCEIGWQR